MIPLALLALLAQAPMPSMAPAKVTISVSKMPLSTLEDTLGSKIRGVAAYSIRVCSDTPVSVSGGKVAQFIESRGVSVIPLEVATISAQRARGRSKLAKMAAVTAQLSFYASLVISGGIVATTSKAAHLAPIVVTHEAERAKDALNTQLPDRTAQLTALALSDAPIALTAGSCVTRLFLGDYQPGFRAMGGEI